MRTLIALTLLAGVAAADPEIDSFNRALAEATRKMDNAATAALWEEDGVSLLPSTKPIVGKKAIMQLIDSITKDHPHARMKSFDLRCFGVERAGDWASEWCVEHQIVEEPRQPTFDSWGKMLLVLHRGSDGKWRLRREMWNQALPDGK